MKSADRFQNPTNASNQLGQTDFTYLKVIGWGWFYLSTVIDDFSRHIVAWRLCTGMTAQDVTDTLDLALQRSNLTLSDIKHQPRRLSDNGPCYLATDVADYRKRAACRARVRRSQPALRLFRKGSLTVLPTVKTRYADQLRWPRWRSRQLSASIPP